MSGPAYIIAAAVTALLATTWAALLALAEEAVVDEAVDTLAQLPPRTGRIGGLHRSLHVARLGLLVIAGGAGAEALGWWLKPWPMAVATLAVAVLLPFALGDAMPRLVAALAPDVAHWAMGIGRRLLIPFAPLLGLALRLDRWAHTAAAGAGRGVEGPGGEAARRDMLLGVFSLGHTTVADVMTPRLDIAGVDIADTRSEVLDAFRRCEHARLPVFDRSPDNVVGVLYAKDLLPAVVGIAQEPERPWQDSIRPPTFVPQGKTLDAQLGDFQRGPSHIAIVVDEYGGTAGLLTREDVLEEIVGEIRDEYDEEEQPAIRQEGEDRFWVDGTVTLDDLSQALGTRIEREDVSTVGGLMLSLLGRVPRPGEQLTLDGFRVVVEQVIRRRVKRVYFERVGGGAAVARGQAREEE